MIPSSKKVSVIRPFVQLAGAALFFLIVPFGIIFGILRRLFGGTHREKDKTCQPLLD